MCAMRAGEMQAGETQVGETRARESGMGAVQAFSADLIAVLVAVTAGEPRILTLQDGGALPSGPFEAGHRSLQSGLRAWVEQQTRHPLGYVEQLYTFADQDRAAGQDRVGGRAGDRAQDGAERAISVSYLALTREGQASGEREEGWRGWYGYFPWEDHRAGPPGVIADAIAPGLRRWADAAGGRARWQRAAATFGLDGRPWNEELVLQRYELLHEVGLVPEARRTPEARRDRPAADALPASVPGRAMHLDHRRILATGIARLRAKIKYRPVVFELMPPEFTLLHLQQGVEGIAGRLLHKQNFRRLVEQQELVEEAGGMAAGTGGRPAKLFRFRREVLAERAVAGTKLPLSRP